MSTLSDSQLSTVCIIVSVLAIFALSGWAWTLTRISTTVVGMLNLRREASRMQDEMDNKVRNRITLINRQIGEPMEEPLDPALVGFSSSNLMQPPDFAEMENPKPRYEDWEAPYIGPDTEV